MSSAKQSALDRLHKLFVDELTAQLKGTTDPEIKACVPPTAAVLAVIGQTLYRAGIEAVQRLADHDHPSHDLRQPALPHER